ncbi:MAG: hypothetical protein L6R40_008442 [Gallowayella cf. fulva]|nr:MAG: hypothetical protein L6R40_008442 [Xanthomendoza cf. fulva]
MVIGSSRSSSAQKRWLVIPSPRLQSRKWRLVAAVVIPMQIPVQISVEPLGSDFNVALQGRASTSGAPSRAIGNNSIMAPPDRPNLTGFDIRKLAASSGHSAKDPWKRMWGFKSTL